jgi:serine/threonine-protein kinase HipA
MAKRVERYDLYLNTPLIERLKVATVALREEHGVLDLFALRYEQDYLNQPNAFALDPVQIPLSNEDIVLTCRAGGQPGLLDDYLPDGWGKKVLSQLTFYKEGKRISEQSPIDLLSKLGSNRIGALQWVPKDQRPEYGLGADISRIAEAEQTAQAVEKEEYRAPSTDEYSLTYLANAGTGVGGARPKALIQENGRAFLAKFNSLTQDQYNNARVELACLNMARNAGINTSTGKVITGINGREVLLLERFDVVTNGRQHLITANALLKDNQNQCDRGGAFRYDDIEHFIKVYSADPQADLEQLLRQMLFNAAINNTDDHERNFSFINTGDGYRLSPAYDMVPSLAVGQYHVAGYKYQTSPPRPSEVSGRIFGLSAPRVSCISEEVHNAIEHWETFFKNVGVSDEDTEQLHKHFRP